MVKVAKGRSDMDNCMKYSAVRTAAQNPVHEQEQYEDIRWLCILKNTPE